MTVNPKLFALSLGINQFWSNCGHPPTWSNCRGVPGLSDLHHASNRSPSLGEPTHVWYLNCPCSRTGFGSIQYRVVLLNHQRSQLSFMVLSISGTRVCPCCVGRKDPHHNSRVRREGTASPHDTNSPAWYDSHGECTNPSRYRSAFQSSYRSSSRGGRVQGNSFYSEIDYSVVCNSPMGLATLPIPP